MRGPGDRPRTLMARRERSGEREKSKEIEREMAARRLGMEEPGKRMIEDDGRARAAMGEEQHNASFRCVSGGGG